MITEANPALATCSDQPAIGRAASRLSLRGSEVHSTLRSRAGLSALGPALWSDVQCLLFLVSALLILLIIPLLSSFLRLAQGSSRTLKVTVMLLYRFLYSSRTTPGLIFVFRYAKR